MFLMRVCCKQVLLYMHVDFYYTYGRCRINIRLQASPEHLCFVKMHTTFSCVFLLQWQDLLEADTQHLNTPKRTLIRWIAFRLKQNQRVLVRIHWLHQMTQVSLIKYMRHKTVVANIGKSIKRDGGEYFVHKNLLILIQYKG